jgi:hypothetical protein
VRKKIYQERGMNIIRNILKSTGMYRK